MDCETLIVSDVHLGSAVSLAAALTHLLKHSKFKRLILLGDIFQDLDFSRLTSEHWKLISYIRKLSNPKRNIEVVWVEETTTPGSPMSWNICLASKSIKSTLGGVAARSASPST